MFIHFTQKARELRLQSCYWLDTKYIYTFGKPQFPSGNWGSLSIFLLVFARRRDPNTQPRKMGFCFVVKKVLLG